MEHHLTFREFGDRYAKLSRDEFLAKFPTPVLVVDFEGLETPPKELPDSPPPPSNALTQFTPGHDEKLNQVAVAPLVKSKRNPMQKAVTLGRAEANDIVVPHGVISKLHAFFKKDPSTGQLSITDANSRFGTAVGGHILPPGESYPLAKKANIVFARYVQAILFFPADFYQHMHLMLHLGREK
jgi:hypothetical protein